MGHADGLCNVFIDESAKLETAIRVVVDSKVRDFDRNYPFHPSMRRLTHFWCWAVFINLI